MPHEEKQTITLVMEDATGINDVILDFVGNVGY